MGLLLWIPGIILGLIHPALFASAYSVSTALIIVGAGLILLQILWVVIIGGLFVAAGTRGTRNRRGF